MRPRSLMFRCRWCNRSGCLPFHESKVSLFVARPSQQLGDINGDGRSSRGDLTRCAGALDKKQRFKVALTSLAVTSG
jgi:hypothetical protein